MARVGEDGNTLDVTLRAMADFPEEAAEPGTAAPASMITLVSTVLPAGVVGFVARSVITPIDSLTGAFSRHCVERGGSEASASWNC